MDLNELFAGYTTTSNILTNIEIPLSMVRVQFCDVMNRIDDITRNECYNVKICDDAN